jgi:hypothetical protein
MYLYVFIFLLISVCGLYTEVYALQAARMFKQQTSIGKIMITWHSSAQQLVKDPLNTITPPCVSVSAKPGPGTLCSVSMAKYLPTTYNPNNYQWNSSVYMVGTQRYLVTYAFPPDGKATTLVAQPAVGYTASEIYQQLRNLGSSSYIYYGMAASGVVTTQEQKPDGTGPVTYTGVPVPDGSVAIVTSP